MAYYDYDSLAKQRVGFGWIDISHRIKKPMALALSQNIAEYWSIELGNYNVPVHFERSFEPLMAWAEQQDLRWVVISCIGTSYSHQYNFIDELSKFLSDMDDADEVAFFGHGLDRKDKFWELHPQCFVVNVEWWKSAGRPDFGDEQSGDFTLPGTVRSQENWHDDYTPHWVHGTNEEHHYTYVKRGWRLFEAAFRSGRKVKSFNRILRDSKLYLYPEVTEDVHRKLAPVFTALQSYRWFVANTETPLHFDFDSVEFDRFDGALCTAGGISPLLTAFKLRMQPGDNLVVADVSPVALLFSERLRNDHINIQDYENEIRRMTMSIAESEEGLQDLFYAVSNTKRMQEIINQQEGLLEYYNNIWPQLNVTFRRINFLNPEDLDWVWRNVFRYNQNVYLNFSNLFSYQNTSWMYSATERLSLERELITRIHNVAPDKYWVKCIRHMGNSWMGTPTQTIVDSGFTEPPIVKEFPWRIV